MYSVLNYGDMLTDRVRVDAYARAIQRVVKPGDVVLDIGAGTGALSVLAAQAGARIVHAIEPNPAVHLLSELAKENGVGDRIEIHATSSLEVELPEPADVVISDLRGSFPLNDYHAEVLRDARQRLLKPTGTMMPVRDRFFVAAVDSPSVARFLHQGIEGYLRLGFKAESVHRSIANSIHTDGHCPVQASDLLTTSELWGAIDYGGPRVPILEGTTRLVSRRGGTAVALAVWFHATIHGDLGYENAPGHTTAYARVLLPLIRPLSLSAGDELGVTLRVDDKGKRWAWDTTHGTETVRQATFLGRPASAASLLRASSGYVPPRSANGARTAAVLALIDGERSLAEIARILGRSVQEVSDAIERLS